MPGPRQCNEVAPCETAAQPRRDNLRQPAGSADFARRRLERQPHTQPELPLVVLPAETVGGRDDPEPIQLRTVPSGFNWRFATFDAGLAKCGVFVAFSASTRSCNLILR